MDFESLTRFFENLGHRSIDLSIPLPAFLIRKLSPVPDTCQYQPVFDSGQLGFV